MECLECGHKDLFHNEADHCSLCHRKRISINTTCSDECMHKFVGVPPVKKLDGEALGKLWEQAVENVDSKHGYSVEYASDPAAHRDEWDKEYRRLVTEKEQLAYVWAHDAPEGQAWACPDCKSWATLGGNAGWHAETQKHGLPTLGPMPKEEKKAALNIDNVFCNNCGSRIYFPERGIVPFDGRFCGHECKGEFDLKKIRHWKR